MTKKIDDHITSGLIKISLALKSSDWEKFSEKGVTPTQKQVLTFLLKQKKDMQTSLTDLAKHLSCTPATTSDIVQKLADKEWVKKEVSKEDKRKIIIQLTSKGEDLSKQALDWSNFLTSAVNDMSDQEKKFFLGGLIKIIKSLQNQNKIPFTRMCLTCTYFQPNQHKDAKKPHHCAFVNAPLAHEQLRLDCEDHEQAENSDINAIWNKFQKIKK